MNQKKRVLSLIITLSMVLSLFVPLGNRAEARPMDNMQTFSLPMVLEDDEPIEDLFDLSSEDNDLVVREFNFKGDTVGVYFNTNIKYPIYGRVPILIKLEYENENTFDYCIEYQMVLKDGDKEIVLENRDIEARNKYRHNEDDKYEVYILGLFPDLRPGNYEISLGVYDKSYYWDNSTGTDSVDEELEEIELEEPVEPVEPIEEIEEIIEDMEMPESLDRATSEILEDPEDPIEDPEDPETPETPEEPKYEPADEPKEELEIPEELMEETENNLEEHSNDSFETELIPVSLSYEEILKEDEIILDKDEMYFYLEDSGIGGKAEAEIVDGAGNVVYTTTEHFGSENYLRERPYYIDNFGSIDYKVYSGSVNLYKCGEVRPDTYTFILKLDGEEVYTKGIEAVNKYPMVNYIDVDKYVLAGDREFNIKVNGEYLNRKDDIKLELVDSSGEVIANSKESHYNSYSSSGYSQILYTMEVESGESLRDYEDYTVNVKYTGNDNFQMKAKYVTIRTTTDPKAVNVDTSRAHMGVLNIEGVNFNGEDKYVVEIRQDGEDIGQFEAESIDSRTLSIRLGQPLEIGNYNISVYKVYNEWDKSYIGNIYFYYEENTFIPDLPTGDPVLNWMHPYYIPQDAVSFNVTVSAYNLDPTSNENAELQIVDKNDNIISSSKDYYVSYGSGGRIYIDFNINLQEKLASNVEYYYIFKWNNEEIKTDKNERLRLRITNKPKLDNFELIGAEMDYEEDGMVYICPLNEMTKDLKFRLRGINIKDKDKFDIYMEDSSGNKVANLESLSGEEDMGIYQGYSGNLKVNKDIEAGRYRIIVKYDNKIIMNWVEVKISNEVYVDYVHVERNISTIDKTINVGLYEPFNIDKDKIDIKIYDLFGKELDTEIDSIEEIRNRNNSLREIDIKLKINDNLTDGYYRAEVYYDGVQLLDDYYSRRIHATGKPIIGTTWLDRFEDENIYMRLTTFAETKNIEPSGGYKGYFYLDKDRRYNGNLEYIGTVDLSIGEKDGKIGIIFPPEKLSYRRL